MARTIKNFDKYLKERKKQSSEFILFDQTIVLPPTLPYDAVLRFNALQMRNASEELSLDDMSSIFEAVIGKSNVELLIGHVEFDIDLMTEIIKFALESYGVGNDSKSVEEEPTEGPKE